MRRAFIVTLLSAAVAFGGVAGSAQTPAAVTVRIATTPIDLGAEALYAADLGFFKRAGLDVEVNLLASGSTVAAAVSGGSIDIGQSNIVALATAHVAGLPFVIVAPAGYYTSAAPTTQLVTAGSAITNAKDLDGKIIAVTALRDLNWVSIQSWLARGGADLASIKYVEIQQPAACNVVTSGRAAAAIVSEPYLSFALRDGGCRVLRRRTTPSPNSFWSARGSARARGRRLIPTRSGAFAP